MQTDLTHLPQSTQQELAQVTAVITSGCDDIAMVILFGSYARGDYKTAEDLQPERTSGHLSDYDILAITHHQATVEDTELWDSINRACEALTLSAPLRLISEDAQTVNIQLAEGHYFFADIKQEGVCLFDAGTLMLAQPRELTAEEKQRIARDHFSHWFERAERFYKNYEENLEKKWYQEAAFMLHQTTEAAYKTILLVFTQYNPNEHYLHLLHTMASKHTPLTDVFPRDTDIERQRFHLLDYAYIGARYDPKYQISQADLEALAKSIQTLINTTQQVCEVKINTL